MIGQAVGFGAKPAVVMHKSSRRGPDPINMPRYNGSLRGADHAPAGGVPVWLKGDDLESEEPHRDTFLERFPAK